MLKKVLLVLIVLTFTTAIQAQDSIVDKGLFKRRDFGKYFYADHYAPIVNMGLGFMLFLNDYNIEPEPRGIVTVAEPILGTQIPLYYYSDGRKKISLSMPISFSVWFDFTEKRTSPILNTDYRVAPLEFNYSHTLNSSFLKNIGFRFIPFFHESTHVGDELILAKVRDTIPSPRINVSYETFELAVQFNDPYGKKIKNHSFRIGAKFLWNPKKGYYTVDTLENSPDIQIEPTSRWIEPYFQYQFQNPNGWLSNKRMMFVVSADFNLRVRYGYAFRFWNSDGVLETYDNHESY